jgi:signal transduction histidine kinase
MGGLSPRNWGLATRLTVGVVGLLLALQLIVLGTYAGNLRERRDTELDNAVDIARTLAAVVDAFTRDLESTTLAAALALGPSATPLDQSTVGPYLASLTSGYGVLRALFITDPIGRVIASDSGVGVGVDVSSRPYIAALQQGAEMAWSEALTGLQTGETTVALARVIPGPDGAARGYLVAAFYPERLVELVPGLPPDAAVVLTDRRGVALYSSAVPSADELDLSGWTAVRDALRGETVRFSDAAVGDGEPRYGALVPVRHVGWVVGFARPQRSLEASLSEAFLRQAGAITLVMLLAIAATAVLARRLAAPLEVLASAATAIARGERPDLPEQIRADVELTQLADAMRAMSAAVGQREQALRAVAAVEQTARTQAEAASTRVRALQAVTDAALAHLGLDELLNQLLTRVREVLDVDTATVLLVDLDEQMLRATAASGLEEEVELGIQVPIGQGFAGRVAAEQRAMILDDVERGEVYSPVLRERGVRSLLGVPLLIEGRLVGVLQVGSLEPRAFTADDASLLRLVADRVALAVDHARLYREAQDAVAARDEFLSVAAHELRTPMTSLRASAQLLMRQLDRTGDTDPERLRQMLEIIESQSERLARLVSQLLDVSRIQAGRLALERQTVDLVELTRSVVDTVRSAASGRSIVVQAPNELLASVDPLRLEQVVTNLVDNAVKYSPELTPIEVELSQPGPHVARLAVSDRGDGVPLEHRERIFDAFFQAASGGRSKGLGLGLYITRQTVELHGGRIEAQFPPEGGTRFVVTIPTEPDGSLAADLAEGGGAS